MFHVVVGKQALQCALRMSSSPSLALVNTQLDFSHRTVKHYFYMRLMKYIVECNDGEIRLVGGSTNLEGTVMLWKQN